MGDRRRHRILADIAALRSAERGAAYQALAEARSLEREAEDAADRADSRTEAAATAWNAHLAGTDFVPELARGLADALIAQGERAALAREHRRCMTEERETSEQAWHDGDARCRLAERALADSRRALRREQDERALAVQADRTASNWRHA
jgi:hypothetical protein